MRKITTVKVRDKTKKELAKIGTKEETYDDIIRRLIDFYKQNNKPVKGE